MRLVRGLYGFMLVVLAICVATVCVGASAPQRIASLHADFSQEIGVVELDGAALLPEELGNLTVHAGSELRIYLVGQSLDGRLFFDQKGETIPTADVSVARLRAAQISVEVDGEGAQAIASVDFAYAGKAGELPTAAPYIRVRFSKEYGLGEASSFSAVIQLYQGGKAIEGADFALSGAMTVRELAVTGSDTVIDLPYGTVLYAEEDVKDLTLHLEGGVTIATSLEAGARYHGSVEFRSEESESGETLLVCELLTKGFRPALTTVRIDQEGVYAVYDGQGKRIGTTRQTLPLESEYILRSERA